MIEQLDKLGVYYIHLGPVEKDKEIALLLCNLLDMRDMLSKVTTQMRIKYILPISDRVIDKNTGLSCAAYSFTSSIHANGNLTIYVKQRNDSTILYNLYYFSFIKLQMSEFWEQITWKLLVPKYYGGCRAYRITGFNVMFDHLEKIHTKYFI